MYALYVYVLCMYDTAIIFPMLLEFLQCAFPMTHVHV